MKIQHKFACKWFLTVIIQHTDTSCKIKTPVVLENEMKQFASKKLNWPDRICLVKCYSSFFEFVNMAWQFPSLMKNTLLVMGDP